MKFVDENGMETEVSMEDLAKMDLQTSQGYLDSAAYAIYPNGSRGYGPNYILRLELEGFIVRVTRFAAQMDRLRESGLSVSELIHSEPFQHDLPLLRNEGRRVADIAKGAGVDFNTGKAGVLSQYVLEGTCAILGARLDMSPATLQIGTVHRELLGDTRPGDTNVTGPHRSLVVRLQPNTLANV